MNNEKKTMESKKYFYDPLFIGYLTYHGQNRRRHWPGDTVNTQGGEYQRHLRHYVFLLLPTSSGSSSSRGGHLQRIIT